MLKEDTFFGKFFSFYYYCNIGNKCSLWKNKLKIKKKEESFKTYKFLPFGNNSVNILA